MHNSLTALLTQVRDGSISVADAALQLREAPFEDLGYARVDHHRRLRQGAAEVIYGAGKTPEQIAGIVDSLQRSGQKTVLITRMKPEAAAYLQERAALSRQERFPGHSRSDGSAMKDILPMAQDSRHWIAYSAGDLSPARQSWWEVNQA